MATSTSDSVRVLDGASEASGPLFVEAGFNHFQSQAQGKRLLEFSISTPATDSVVRLTFGGRDGEWASPITGAFGGLTWVGETPAASTVDALLDGATRRLATEGGRRLSIRLPPDGMADAAAPVLENSLFRAGWRLAEVDINTHIPVTVPTAWLGDLGETRRKELRRLERSGASFSPTLAGESVHAVIAENRAARGFPMTMGWPLVDALARAFPKHVGFFTVTDENEILAAAIRLQVSKTCDYVFYWGERPSARRRSPVILLASGLVSDAHERGVTILDLGTSSDHSQPNPGLIAFKESLGGRLSARRTWELNLDCPAGQTMAR